MEVIRVKIPGEPVTQGRPRAVVIHGKARVFDPSKSRSWKGAARHEMALAVDGSTIPFAQGPLAVIVRAFHLCPKGDYRKRQPALLRWRGKRPDAENIAKAVLDAAIDVLWSDDAQVARLVVEQFTAAQGEAPRVELEVGELPVVAARGRGRWRLGNGWRWRRELSGSRPGVELLRKEEIGCYHGGLEVRTRSVALYGRETVEPKRLWTPPHGGCWKAAGTPGPEPGSVASTVSLPPFLPSRPPPEASRSRSGERRCTRRARR